MNRRQSDPIPRSERGAAMLAALCLAMVFAISLSSYVALCYTSLLVSTRNQLSGFSYELAESGMEQALYVMNNTNHAPSDWVGAGFALSGTTATASLKMTSSGLLATSSSPLIYYGNGATGVANIVVTNYTSSNPTITSQGVITLPNSNEGNGIAGTTVSRTLTYTGPSGSQAASGPVFVNAVAATTGTVKFSKYGSLDSFSSNPSVGTYQTYGSSVATASAIVLAGNTTSGGYTVRLKDAVLNGYAVGYNTDDISSPGTHNWLSVTSGEIIGPSTATGTTLDLNRIIATPLPYQPVYPENLPNGTGNIPSTCTTGGNILNTTSILGSASTYPIYTASGINLANNSVVTIAGPVVLIVYGNVTIANTAQIQLVNSNASLAIFLENGIMNLGGNGITNINTVPLPKRVAIMSTNNNSTSNSVTISSLSAFYGVVYFPYLAVTISSPSTAPIYGSIVGESVTISNSATIHYDEALRLPDTSSSTLGTAQDMAFAYLNAPFTVGNLVQSVP